MSMRIVAAMLTCALLMTPTLFADQDLNELRKQADTLLGELPDIPSDLNKTSYYEVLHKTIHIPEFVAGGRRDTRQQEEDDVDRFEEYARYKSVGWFTTTLKSERVAGERRYVLSGEYMFDVPKGPAAEGDIKVIMDEGFMPIQFDRMQDLVSVYYGTAKTKERFTLHDRKITFRKIIDGVRRPKKEIQRAPGRLVFITSGFLVGNHIIEAFDLERGQKFAYIEVDPDLRGYIMNSCHVKRLRKERREETGAEYRVSVEQFRVGDKVEKSEQQKKAEESGPAEDDEEREFKDPSEYELVFEPLNRDSSDKSPEHLYYLVNKDGDVIESGYGYRNRVIVVTRKIDEKRFKELKKKTEF